MKNKITVLALAFISAFTIAKAQLVPNANMELWTDHGNYDDPNFWATPNSATGLFTIYEVFKDSVIVNSGNYASRMENKTVPGFGTVPGVMATGTLDIFNVVFNGGFPMTDSLVEAMTGYYKYSPVGTDSAFMYAVLFHRNTVTHERDTVGFAEFHAGTTANYTFFAAPFTILMPGQAPDSAMVITSAALDIANASAGSTLWIDDIDFTNNLGIPAVQNASLNLYPNPADKIMSLTLPQELNAQSISISNVGGARVREMKVTSREVNINTASLAQGNYVLSVKNSEGKIVASGKFTVKH